VHDVSTKKFVNLYMIPLCLELILASVRHPGLPSTHAYFPSPTAIWSRAVSHKNAQLNSKPERFRFGAGPRLKLRLDLGLERP
jgi:hypothetical protein